MREGPFDIKNAVPAELVGREVVVSKEDTIQVGETEVSELFTAIQERLMTLKEHSVCKLLERKKREDLTVSERFVMSNRAQAAAFFRTAESQMTQLDALVAVGADPGTQIAHIRQSLLITETRMTEAIDALSQLNVPTAVKELEVERVEITEAPANQEETPSFGESSGVEEEINPTTEIIDTITDTLEAVTKRGKREQSRIEVSELIRLRASLIALDKRYQNFAHSTHKESDKTVRDIIAAKTLTVIENTKQEAETHLSGLQVALARVPEETIKTEPKIGWFTPGYSGRNENVPAAEDVAEETTVTSEVTPSAQETIIPKVTPITPLIPKSSIESESARKEAEALAESYTQVLKDVRVLRKMPERIISGSKEFPEILASREAALTVEKSAYEALLLKQPALVPSLQQAEVKKAELALNPPSVSERLAAATAKVWSRTPNREGRILKAEPPMETGVVLLDPTEVTQTDVAFADKNVIDASPKDIVLEKAKVEAMETIMDALNETVSVSEGQQNKKSEAVQRESIPPVTTVETLKQYIQNFEGGKDAFQDSFDDWVDTIQDVHPSRWRPIALFGSSETHTDAFSHFKKMSVGEFRDIIKMPENARQAKLFSHKIQPEDFEKWRRELTISAMVDGVRDCLYNPSTTFEDWARYSFAASKIADQQFLS